LSELAARADSFLAGTDLSLLAYFETNGVVYRNGGQQGDAISILKNQGVNCVRLRLFTSSAAQAQADPYDYVNNLNYTVPLAARVKKAGMKFLLDFHYSDTWADPGHQAVPSGWTNLTFIQLVQQMHDYSSNCIAAFQAAGAMPDYVQVGNEITSGMLWPSGRVGGSYDTPAQWSQLAQLLNAAIRGIHDAAGANPPKTVIHIASGGDWNTTQWFFDNLIQSQRLQFDIVGESYYPFYHGSLSNLNLCLSNAAARYGKPLIVAETAFPWTNSVFTTNLDGFSGTTNGQAEYVVALAEAVRCAPNNLSCGIFWWGAEYQQLSGIPEAGFSTTSFFDANGNVLPAVTVLGQVAAPVRLSLGNSPAGLLLQWPLSGVNMSLVTATSLAPNAVWLTASQNIRISNAAFSATVQNDFRSSHFYRLQAN
jgi:arabinogalactan endo-1,4-beta-galactosidase